MHFINESCVFCFTYHWSLLLIPKGLIDNMWALGLVMAWRRIGDKPLPEPMLTQFIDTYLQHWGRWAKWYFLSLDRLLLCAIYLLFNGCFLMNWGSPMCQDAYPFWSWQFLTCVFAECFCCVSLLKKYMNVQWINWVPENKNKIIANQKFGFQKFLPSTSLVYPQCENWSR